MGTIQSLGFISLGDSRSFQDKVDGFFSAPNRKLYEFRTGSTRANVSISTQANGAPTIPGADVNLNLFRDSNENGSDNYAFSLKRNSSVNIKVQELGNLSGEANIRVVRDRNANGIVDKNEVIAKGISNETGLDEVSVSGRGDYILQVCQSQGAVRYVANFDVTNSAALKI